MLAFPSLVKDPSVSREMPMAAVGNERRLYLQTNGIFCHKSGLFNSIKSIFYIIYNWIYFWIKLKYIGILNNFFFQVRLAVNEAAPLQHWTLKLKANCNNVIFHPKGLVNLSSGTEVKAEHAGNKSSSVQFPWWHINLKLFLAFLPQAESLIKAKKSFVNLLNQYLTKTVFLEYFLLELQAPWGTVKAISLFLLKTMPQSFLITLPRQKNAQSKLRGRRKIPIISPP